MTQPDSPNAEQIRFWNLVGGPRWARLERALDAQLAPYAEAVVRAAAPRPGERAVDVGCGAGALCLRLAESVGPSGSVLGVDVSRPLLERARERASAFQHVSFECEDAQLFEFEPGARDLVCSRFGVMFFADPIAAFRNLGVALRRGGRLSYVCWDKLERNEWAHVPLRTVLEFVPTPAPKPPGTPGPFSMWDPAWIKGLLETAGFEQIAIAPLEQPMRIGGGKLAEAVDLLLEVGPGASALREAESPPLERVREALAAMLAGHVTAEHAVEMGASAWLVTARRS